MVPLLSCRSLSLALFATLGGCASTESPPAATPSATTTSFAEQVAAGGALYRQSCAHCHGDDGEGGKAPRVVGLKEGALPLEPPAGRKLRKGRRFVTVADVAAMVVASMPPKKADALTTDQYWAILAFNIYANGIDLPIPLTPTLAETLTIPR